MARPHWLLTSRRQWHRLRARRQCMCRCAADNWSGFYIGGNLGAGWNSTGSITDTFGSTFGTTTNTQFLGGGQVGVNYEFWGGVVVGAEAMFDWLPNTSNTISVTNAASGTASATINNRWLTTATGKLGYAWDRVLAVWQGRWCLGRHKQSFDYGQWCTGLVRQ